MYTCYTCCMGREMMEMNGRDSAKCRKSKLMDIIGIIEILNDNKDKILHSVVSHNEKEPKRNVKGRRCRT